MLRKSTHAEIKNLNKKWIKDQPTNRNTTEHKENDLNEQEDEFACYKTKLIKSRADDSSQIWTAERCSSLERPKSQHRFAYEYRHHPKLIWEEQPFHNTMNLPSRSTPAVTGHRTAQWPIISFILIKRFCIAHVFWAHCADFNSKIYVVNYDFWEQIWTDGSSIPVDSDDQRFKDLISCNHWIFFLHIHHITAQLQFM